MDLIQETTKNKQITVAGNYLSSWCYHIPDSSSPVDFMKKDRIFFLIQLLLGCALFLGLLLVAIDFYSLSDNSNHHVLWKALHKVSLTESILLVIVLAIANFLFLKFRNLVSQDNQHVDLLTGFVTRHAFGEIFEHALLDAKRSLEPLSVLIVDIDHFRGVNELYGHQVGDELLSMFSKSIQTVLRASDTTCRWEGDQFLVILKDCSTKDGCRIAEKMLARIRGQVLGQGERKITITASMGIAQMISGDTIETIVSRAETGLHSARDNGRNRCAIGYDWILINYVCEPILLPA